jgi:superfamily I DNA/RNA helicase
MSKRKSLLLTYTKSLEAYLAASARQENDESGENVGRTLWWTTHEANNGFGEIIIDEAQDVDIEKYRQINGLTQMVSYSADNNQQQYPDQGVTEADLRGLFLNNVFYRLRSNFRNSNQVVQFVRSLLPHRMISNGNNDGSKPSVVCSDGDGKVQDRIVLDMIRNFEGQNIAVLLPKKAQVDGWYTTLQEAGINCSKFTGNDGHIGTIENVHVTTFKSSKGLEFDTVILPNFDNYEYNIANLFVAAENDYYVVFTRARRNLMLVDNSRLDNDGKCSLNFLKTQIEDGIVKVDYDYIKKSTPLKAVAPPPTYRSALDDIDDDLPF